MLIHNLHSSNVMGCGLGAQPIRKECRGWSQMATGGCRGSQRVIMEGHGGSWRVVAEGHGGSQRVVTQGHGGWFQRVLAPRNHISSGL